MPPKRLFPIFKFIKPRIEPKNDKSPEKKLSGIRKDETEERTFIVEGRVPVIDLPERSIDTIDPPPLQTKPLQLVHLLDNNPQLHPVNPLLPIFVELIKSHKAVSSGDKVGEKVGNEVGKTVGEIVGKEDGTNEGTTVGNDVGERVGDWHSLIPH